jgi:hypothetical protein
MQRNAFDPAWVRKRLILTLVISIAVANSFIIFPDSENRSLFSNWTINAAVAVALGISILVVWRQKLDGLNGRTYAAFSIGLALWFVAEILWTYYELVAGIEDPFPSLADAFWIAGYAPFAYHLMATYKFFGQTVKPHVMIIASIAAALFVGHTSTMVFEASTLATHEDFTAAAISIAYLVLDAVLIVPAIIVLVSLRHGKLTFTPWIILASSLLITAAADSGFAYYEAVGMSEEIWIWDLLYCTSYIAMAATLFWHYRFFIYHEKKVRKIWQEENR